MGRHFAVSLELQLRHVVGDDHAGRMNARAEFIAPLLGALSSIGLRALVLVAREGELPLFRRELDAASATAAACPANYTFGIEDAMAAPRHLVLQRSALASLDAAWRHRAFQVALSVTEPGFDPLLPGDVERIHLGSGAAASSGLLPFEVHFSTFEVEQMYMKKAFATARHPDVCEQDVTDAATLRQQAVALAAALAAGALPMHPPPPPSAGPRRFVVQLPETAESGALGVPNSPIVPRMELLEHLFAALPPNYRSFVYVKPKYKDEVLGALSRVQQTGAVAPFMHLADDGSLIPNRIERLFVRADCPNPDAPAPAAAASAAAPSAFAFPSGSALSSARDRIARLGFDSRLLICSSQPGFVHRGDIAIAEADSVQRFRLVSDLVGPDGIVVHLCSFAAKADTNYVHVRVGSTAPLLFDASDPSRIAVVARELGSRICSYLVGTPLAFFDSLPPRVRDALEDEPWEVISNTNAPLGRRITSPDELHQLLVVLGGPVDAASMPLALALVDQLDYHGFVDVAATARAFEAIPAPAAAEQSPVAFFDTLPPAVRDALEDEPWEVISNTNAPLGRVIATPDELRRLLVVVGGIDAAAAHAVVAELERHGFIIVAPAARAGDVVIPAPAVQQLPAPTFLPSMPALAPVAHQTPIEFFDTLPPAVRDALEDEPWEVISNQNVPLRRIISTPEELRALLTVLGGFDAPSTAAARAIVNELDRHGFIVVAPTARGGFAAVPAPAVHHAPAPTFVSSIPAPAPAAHQTPIEFFDTLTPAVRNALEDEPWEVISNTNAPLHRLIATPEELRDLITVLGGVDASSIVAARATVAQLELHGFVVVAAAARTVANAAPQHAGPAPTLVNDVASLVPTEPPTGQQAAYAFFASLPTGAREALEDDWDVISNANVPLRRLIATPAELRRLFIAVGRGNEAAALMIVAELERHGFVVVAPTARAATAVHQAPAPTFVPSLPAPAPAAHQTPIEFFDTLPPAVRNVLEDEPWEVISNTNAPLRRIISTTEELRALLTALGGIDTPSIAAAHATVAQLERHGFIVCLGLPLVQGVPTPHGRFFSSLPRGLRGVLQDEWGVTDESRVPCRSLIQSVAEHERLVADLERFHVDVPAVLDGLLQHGFIALETADAFFRRLPDVLQRYLVEQLGSAAPGAPPAPMSAAVDGVQLRAQTLLSAFDERGLCFHGFIFISTGPPAQFLRALPRRVRAFFADELRVVDAAFNPVAGAAISLAIIERFLVDAARAHGLPFWTPQRIMDGLVRHGIVRMEE